MFGLSRQSPAKVESMVSYNICNRIRHRSISCNIHQPSRSSSVSFRHPRIFLRFRLRLLPRHSGAIFRRQALLSKLGDHGLVRNRIRLFLQLRLRHNLGFQLFEELSRTNGVCQWRRVLQQGVLFHPFRFSHRPIPCSMDDGPRGKAFPTRARKKGRATCVSEAKHASLEPRDSGISSDKFLASY